MSSKHALKPYTQNLKTLQPQNLNCDISSVGRALASQAEGRGFESRMSLAEFNSLTIFQLDCQRMLFITLLLQKPKIGC